MTSPFEFLQAEWPAVHEAAIKAAAAVHPDPRTACFYSRRALELAVAWVYKHDPALRLPYQDNLSARESSMRWATRPCIAIGQSSNPTR